MENSNLKQEMAQVKTNQSKFENSLKQNLNN